MVLKAESSVIGKENFQFQASNFKSTGQCVYIGLDIDVDQIGSNSASEGEEVGLRGVVAAPNGGLVMLDFLVGSDLFSLRCDSKESLSLSPILVKENVALDGNTKSNSQ